MTLAVFVFLVFFSIQQKISPDNFETRLIVKLSEILEVSPPDKVVINRLSEKDMLDNYDKWLTNPCIKEGGGVEFCKIFSYSPNIFLQGRWIIESDQTFLHIELHKGAGMDILIHEFLHWYLWNKDPKDNNEEAVKRILYSILVSPEFKDWLETEEK